MRTQFELRTFVLPELGSPAAHCKTSAAPPAWKFKGYCKLTHFVNRSWHERQVHLQGKWSLPWLQRLSLQQGQPSVQLGHFQLRECPLYTQAVALQMNRVLMPLAPLGFTERLATVNPTPYTRVPRCLHTVGETLSKAEDTGHGTYCDQVIIYLAQTRSCCAVSLPLALTTVASGLTTDLS